MTNADYTICRFVSVVQTNNVFEMFMFIISIDYLSPLRNY